MSAKNIPKIIIWLHAHDFSDVGVIFEDKITCLRINDLCGLWHATIVDSCPFFNQDGRQYIAYFGVGTDEDFFVGWYKTCHPPIAYCYKHQRTPISTPCSITGRCCLRDWSLVASLIIHDPWSQMTAIKHKCQESVIICYINRIAHIKSWIP